jgi:two-component system KDP operon response regulator KdpE
VASCSSEHILVVEDDPLIGEAIQATLEYAGYTCETAITAASALDRFKSGHPDAIVADLGLPDCNGIELISVLRGLSQIPVIVVSGHTAEAEKIAALDHGADDYIEKPFLPAELVARIRAKLRVAKSHQLEESDDLHRIDWEADACLSRMERALLAFLVQHKGATVSEDEIIGTLWGPHRMATSADLRSLVLKLRRKLEEQRLPLFVLNDRGIGYHVSGFGRFPRRARETQFAREASRPAQQASHPFMRDIAVEPAPPSPSGIALPFSCQANVKRARGSNQ